MAPEFGLGLCLGAEEGDMHSRLASRQQERPALDRGGETGRLAQRGEALGGPYGFRGRGIEHACAARRFGFGGSRIHRNIPRDWTGG